MTPGGQEQEEWEERDKQVENIEQDNDDEDGEVTCWLECRAARLPPLGAASVRSARRRSWIGRLSGASSPREMI